MNFLINYYPEIAIGLFLGYLLYIAISFAIKLKTNATKLDLEYQKILSEKVKVLKDLKEELESETLTKVEQKITDLKKEGIKREEKNITLGQSQLKSYESSEEAISERFERIFSELISESKDKSFRHRLMLYRYLLSEKTNLPYHGIIVSDSESIDSELHETIKQLETISHRKYHQEGSVNITVSKK